MINKGITPKRVIGFCGGLAVCLLIWNLPLSALPADGQRCLALSMAAVVWWAVGVINPGYTALALLMCFSVFLSPETAPRSLIFSLWASPIMYLVISGFLVAAAVQRSGLGRRIALSFVMRFVRSYKGIIISCYLLGLILSFMIPHPWPRSLMLVSVMIYVIKATGLEGRAATNIKLAVFVGSVPTSMVLLTGDSILNSAVSGFVSGATGSSITYLQWILYMGLPGILASLLTCAVQIFLYKGPKKLDIDFGDLRAELNNMGKISGLEKRTIVAIVLAVLLWCTDMLHGINPGWVMVIAALILALPVVEVLVTESWTQVNVGTLLFLCAALAIGTVGEATGMNEWILHLLLPGSAPSNPYVFALLCMAISMAVHMLLGSALAVLGIVTPAMMAFGAMANFPPIVSAFIVYSSVALHWILPIHHVNLVVGLGEHYDERQIMRAGIPQTAVAVFIILFQVFWWSLVGIIR